MSTTQQAAAASVWAGLNRNRFPGLADGWVRADAPSGTQPLGSCIEAMRAYMATGRAANLHGAFEASVMTDQVVAEARRKVAGLLGGEPEGVVFGPSMTALTFRFARAVAKTLRPGDRVVSTVLEHDANLRPWKLAAQLAGAEFALIDVSRPSLDLDRESIAETVNERTRWVAVSGAANATGVVPDLGPVVTAARSAGARVYVDAVHATPHLAIDRHRLGADVIACSAYKWFGPHVGILCTDPQLLHDLTPDKLLPSPDEPPERWELGALPFEALAGICAVADYLLETGMPAIEAHDQVLAGVLRDGLAAIDGVTVFSSAQRHTPTAFFTVGGKTGDQVAADLAAHRIAATSGNLYAIELSKAIGLGEAGAARVGFAHYSGIEDVQHVLSAIGAITRS